MAKIVEFMLCVFYHNKTPYGLHLFIAKTMTHRNLRRMYAHKQLGRVGQGCRG